MTNFKKSLLVIPLCAFLLSPVLTVQAQTVQTQEQAKQELIKTLQALLKLLIAQLEQLKAQEANQLITAPSAPQTVYQPNASLPQERVIRTGYTYTITPQSGSPLQPRHKISFEQLRQYVLSTNYDYVAFRKKMEVATEQDLIDYLVANGFKVTKE